MKRGLKVLTVAVAIVGMLFVSSGVLLAASVVRSGMVTVHVKEKQDGQNTNVYVPVPAGLIYGGLALAEVFAPEELAKARTEIGEAGPALAEVLRALEDCPDAVLVDVQDDDEHVQIAKRGRSFEIHVKDGESDVHVSLPAGLMSRIAGTLS